MTEVTSVAPAFRGDERTADQLVRWLEARGYSAEYVPHRELVRSYIELRDSSHRIYPFTKTESRDGVLEIASVSGGRTVRVRRSNTKTFDAVLREAYYAGFREGNGYDPGCSPEAFASFDEWKRGQLP